MATTLTPTQRTARAAGRSGPGGFRGLPKQRGKFALGLLLVVLAVLVNVALFRRLDERVEVVQLARDVPAGAQISAADLRTAKIGESDSFRAVPAAHLSSMVGTYAKVRMISGTLLAAESTQAEPLVAPGRAVVAITVPAGHLPVGLREQSRVRLVIPDDAGGPPIAIEGFTAGLPVDGGVGSDSKSVSVEVADADAATIAAADDVRVVLLEPVAGG